MNAKKKSARSKPSIKKEEPLAQRSFAHQKYFLKSGERVPSVTTVLNEMAKPALIHWAWNLGMQHIDYRSFRDELADIGSLVHQMILDFFAKRETNFSEYSPKIKDKAENCFISFLEWMKHHEIKPILIEQPFVSETYGFGGKLDLLCELDSALTLVDFKSGKSIYDESFHQQAAYLELINENRPDLSAQISASILVNIGRSEDEHFAVKRKAVGMMGPDWDIFHSLLQVYKAKQRLHSSEMSAA